MHILHTHACDIVLDATSFERLNSLNRVNSWGWEALGHMYPNHILDISTLRMTRRTIILRYVSAAAPAYSPGPQALVESLAETMSLCGWLQQYLAQESAPLRLRDG